MKYSLLILPAFDVLVLLEEITTFMYLFFCSSVLLIIDIIFRHGMIIIPLICALIYMGLLVRQSMHRITLLCVRAGLVQPDVLWQPRK
jgi:hypothetical protein